LRSEQFLSYSTNSQAFTASKDSLLCSQEPIIGIYIELTNKPHPFSYYPSIYAQVFQTILSSGFLTKILYAILTASMYVTHPAHLIFCELIIPNTVLLGRIHIMKVLNTQFSPGSNDNENCIIETFTERERGLVWSEIAREGKMNKQN
jgi:hypothetical protein